jgi:cellulose synthase/poly-beta-1,6-N-acetylglucosamine synthase-like glycosyltransferase
VTVEHTGLIKTPAPRQLGPDSPRSVSVVVPTYGRPDRLVSCLDGLRVQSRPADEVIVIVHVSDEPSAVVVRQLAQRWPELRHYEVPRHGLVAALNGGLAIARGSIVAFIDDDAVPIAGWLERIVQTFERDERIAAVGGRDVVVVDGKVVDLPETSRQRSEGPVVGRVQWFGRMYGNHHLGRGSARDVDVIKGANMSFRRTTVIGHGFDNRLTGRGVQMHSELSICLPLRRRGLRVVYDPEITVTHYPAPRVAGDLREDPRREAVAAAAHNEALSVLDHFGPPRRVVYAAWAFAIGARDAPGLAILGRDLLVGSPAAWPRFAAAQRGRAAAWRTRRITRQIRPT